MRRLKVSARSHAANRREAPQNCGMNWGTSYLRRCIRDYAMPYLGRKTVDAITTADVMAVLVPIWSTKRETAHRVRQRIGAVMKWSVAHRYRQDNPAGDAIAKHCHETARPPRFITAPYRMPRSVPPSRRSAPPGHTAQPCWPSSSPS